VGPAACPELDDDIVQGVLDRPLAVTVLVDALVEVR